MVRFETKVYNYSADDKIIGAEVIVYNEQGDKVKSIVVTDETQIQELEAKLDVIDDTYVKYSNLDTILANIEEDTDINATELNGHSGQDFVLEESMLTRRMTPTSHASSNKNDYGPATTTNYGHVRLVNNLTAASLQSGEALSAYQGAVLRSQIVGCNANITDILQALTVKTATGMNSKFKLYKYGNVASLHVVNWQANNPTRDDYFNTNVVIPTGFRPPATTYINDAVVAKQHLVI